MIKQQEEGKNNKRKASKQKKNVRMNKIETKLKLKWSSIYIIHVHRYINISQHVSVCAEL